MVTRNPHRRGKYRSKVFCWMSKESVLDLDGNLVISKHFACKDFWFIIQLKQPSLLMVVSGSLYRLLSMVSGQEVTPALAFFYPQQCFVFDLTVSCCLCWALWLEALLLCLTLQVFFLNLEIHCLLI